MVSITRPASLGHRADFTEGPRSGLWQSLQLMAASGLLPAGSVFPTQKSDVNDWLTPNSGAQNED